VALIDKSEFVGLEVWRHLCTGGGTVAPVSQPRLRAFGALKSAGMAGREEMFVTGERARGRGGPAAGRRPAELAFRAHSSEGLKPGGTPVEWRAGDNVVFASTWSTPR